MDFFDPAIGAHDVVDIANDEGGLEPDGLARGEPEPFAVGLFPEIVPFHPEFSAEWHGAGAGGGILGIVFGGQVLGLALGIVRDDELDGVEHGHGTVGDAVQMVAQGPLQQAEVDDVFPLGDADPVAKGADALWGEAAAAQA